MSKTPLYDINLLQKKKIIFIIFFFASFFSPYTKAGLTCSSTLKGSNLVLQTDSRLNHRYTCMGLCGISSVVNSYQLLLAENNLPLILDPYALINSINEDYIDSRSSNLAILDKMIEVVATESKEVTQLDIEHRILALPYPMFHESPNIDYTTEFSLNSLTIRESEKKILALVFFNEVDDSYVASHTVTLVNFDDKLNIATVIDPNMPYLPLKFKVQLKVLDEDEGFTLQFLPLKNDIRSEFGKILYKSVILLNYVADIKAKK